MMDVLRTFAEGLDHPEGVAWSPTEHAYYAGGEAGQVYRVMSDGTHVTIADTGGFVLGLVHDGANHLYVCDRGRAELVRVHTGTGETSAYSTGSPDRRCRTPNAAAFGSDGALYYTDSGRWAADDGCIFRVTPTGTTTVWTDEPSAFPNGCCVSAGGDELIVVESTAQRLTALLIAPDGSYAGRRTIASLPGTVPDGVAATADGNYIVACYRPDRLLLVTGDGVVSVLADDPTGTMLAAPTNAAFGGPSLATLVVANLGRWHLAAANFGFCGLPLRYPKEST